MSNDPTGANVSTFDVLGEGYPTIFQMDRLPPENAVRFGYGQFNPSAGLPNDPARYGLNQPGIHVLGEAFGPHRGTVFDMQIMADQGRLVRYGVHPGTKMTEGAYDDANWLRAMDESGNFKNTSILGDNLEASQAQWNADNPQAQPGAHQGTPAAGPTPAAPGKDPALTAGQPHLQLLVEAQNSIHELDKAFPGGHGHGGGPWAVKLRDLATKVVSELGAKG